MYQRVGHCGEMLLECCIVWVDVSAFVVSLWRLRCVGDLVIAVHAVYATIQYAGTFTTPKGKHARASVAHWMDVVFGTVRHAMSIMMYDVFIHGLHG